MLIKLLMFVVPIVGFLVWQIVSVNRELRQSAEQDGGSDAEK